LLGLATLHLQADDPQSALPLLRRCCAVAPSAWAAWDALSSALGAAGELVAAHTALARAFRLARDRSGLSPPAVLRLALRLADAAIAAGLEAAALALLTEASERDPLDPAPLAARGSLLGALGRTAEAADVLGAAAALAPADPSIGRMHAEALIRAGRNVELVEVLRQAVAGAPEDVSLRNHLGAALMRAHRPLEASATFAELRRVGGERAEVLCNLAGALLVCGEQELALDAARRATELEPAAHLPWRMFANVQAYADGVSARAMLDALRMAGARAPRGAVAPFERRPGPGEADKILRVGLLSATLRTHPVAWLALAGLEMLDPAHFELVCLAQPESADPMQRRFRAAAREWHVVGPTPAAQARALDLDILIDLGGYGDHGLLPACAERLAPMQVKWVGLQNHSTGLAEMDWFVTDRWATPAELAGAYSERLIVMPDGYVCYTPPPHAPDVSPPPVMQRGYVTFGCFNNYAKITAELVSTWCNILHAVPDARLLLKCHQFQESALAAKTVARFAAHGIAPERIEVRGMSAHRELLAQYADVDIVLDTHPYSGGVTTCEALWMGVPVLTLPGETFASRHSTSHLSNAGLADWVAADRADYVRSAIARAGDPATLATLRAGLRRRMRASPLCDAPRFGRNLGTALRQAWQEMCRA
jgi:predicted O-linked N-acetylglucosamine transferase (SPINDLY family)